MSRVKALILCRTKGSTNFIQNFPILVNCQQVSKQETGIANSKPYYSLSASRYKTSNGIFRIYIILHELFTVKTAQFLFSSFVRIQIITRSLIINVLSQTLMHILAKHNNNSVAESDQRAKELNALLSFPTELKFLLVALAECEGIIITVNQIQT